MSKVDVLRECEVRRGNVNVKLRAGDIGVQFAAWYVDVRRYIDMRRLYVDMFGDVDVAGNIEVLWANAEVDMKFGRWHVYVEVAAGHVRVQLIGRDVDVRTPTYWWRTEIDVL